MEINIDARKQPKRDGGPMHPKGSAERPNCVILNAAKGIIEYFRSIFYRKANNPACLKSWGINIWRFPRIARYLKKTIRISARDNSRGGL